MKRNNCSDKAITQDLFSFMVNIDDENPDSPSCIEYFNDCILKDLEIGKHGKDLCSDCKIKNRGLPLESRYVFLYLPDGIKNETQYKTTVEKIDKCDNKFLDSYFGAISDDENSDLDNDKHISVDESKYSENDFIDHMESKIKHIIPKKKTFNIKYDYVLVKMCDVIHNLIDIDANTLEKQVYKYYCFDDNCDNKKLIWNENDFCLSLLKQNALLLEFIDNDFQTDKILRQCMKTNPYSIKYANKRLLTQMIIDSMDFTGNVYNYEGMTSILLELFDNRLQTLENCVKASKHYLDFKKKNFNESFTTVSYTEADDHKKLKDYMNRMNKTCEYITSKINFNILERYTQREKIFMELALVHPYWLKYIDVKKHTIELYKKISVNDVIYFFAMDAVQAELIEIDFYVSCVCISPIILNLMDVSKEIYIKCVEHCGVTSFCYVPEQSVDNEMISTLVNYERKMIFDSEKNNIFRQNAYMRLFKNTTDVNIEILKLMLSIMKNTEPVFSKYKTLINDDVIFSLIDRGVTINIPQGHITKPVKEMIIKCYGLTFAREIVTEEPEMFDYYLDNYLFADEDIKEMTENNDPLIHLYVDKIKNHIFI